MELTALETDLLGDLAQDDHGLWEIAGFVRLHAKPARADTAHVLPRTRTLLRAWIDRGWLELAPLPDHAPPLITDIDQLIPLLDQLGALALEYIPGAPWLRLTQKAWNDTWPTRDA